MNLIPQPTVLDLGLIAGAEAANHFATVLRTQWQQFWMRDSATVTAELNADVARALQIFALNSQAAQGVNALLEAINDPRFSARAPDAMPDYWSFDGAAFIYSPPPPPEITEPEMPNP